MDAIEFHFKTDISNELAIPQGFKIIAGSEHAFRETSKELFNLICRHVLAIKLDDHIFSLCFRKTLR